MKKKIISVACAAMLCISLTSCSGGEFMSKLAGNSSKWVDSDLIGAVSADAEIRLQDDFAAAVNKDWKLQQGDNYEGLFQDTLDSVLENKLQIATDDSIQGETAERVRTFYGLSSNWDDRAADGIEPLRPYIEDIESIQSMDELYQFFGDIERNPLHMSPVTTQIERIGRCEKDKESYMVMLTTPEMSLTDKGQNRYYFILDYRDAFEKYEQVREKTDYLLGKLGYSDKESEKLLTKCMEWEKKVAEADNTASIKDPDDMIFEHAEAVKIAGDFPMEDILTSWGFGNAKYISINPSYAKKLDSLCKKGNLDNIKAFLIVNYCLQSSTYLDRDTYDKMQEIGTPKIEKEIDQGRTEKQIEDELQFEKYIGETPIVGAMNQVYVENFFDDSVIDDLNTITEDVIDGYRHIFSNEPWLSEEGKAACIEKLDAIKIHIAYQDFDSVDYSKLELKSHEEGGSFLEAYFQTKRFEMEHMTWLAEQSYNRDYWDPMNPGLSTTITNAMYNPSTNGIYIFAGIIADPIYRKDMAYEEKLGKLFPIVGHEITHGFDKSGSQYDKEGDNNPILSTEDQKEFNDRNDKVATYYTTMNPFPGSTMITGNMVNGEATADMGGIAVTLYLASLEDDFDYDLYFRSYAELWRENVSKEAEKKFIKMDVHPLAFYRVNIGLQQFDEFYETYDIKEGDGMYVAPDKRIKVW